jgi:hypothetical protein
MKSLLLLFTICLSMNLFGQTYTPFISADSTDQWKDTHACGVNGGGSCLEYYRTVYHLDGDTILDGNQYAKVYALEQHSIENGFFGPFPCDLSSVVTSFFAGGIRETGKQVFFYEPDLAAEYLMYDFTLGVGDTVPDPDGFAYGLAEKVIDSIDSVLIDGTYRKRYNLANASSFPWQIIEGIGAGTGFKQPIMASISCSSSLDCYLENEMVVYSESGSCALNLNNDELFTENSFEIYPQPVKFGEHFSVRATSNELTTVSIYDVFGRLVYDNGEFDGEVSIRANWDAGIYFVKVGTSSALSKRLVIYD